MHGIALALAAVAVAACSLAAPAGAAEPTPAVSSRAQDTLKERLSDKASDEQRVNDCKVPQEKRGAKKRPGCPVPSGGGGRK